MKIKRFLAGVLAVVLVFSAYFSYTTPLTLASEESENPQKLIFNAYNDFSADGNPNLPWKYQYRVMENDSYVYYDLTKDTREGVVNTWNTNDYAAIAKTQGDLVTSTTNDVLNLSPWTDTHQAVLTFVAPYSGKIHISMTNGGVFAPYSPETGVSFWLLQNEEIKVSKTDLGYDDGYNNRFFAGTETLTVEEGDIIRFVIGRNAAIDGRSYFNPEIQYTQIEDGKVLFNGYDDFSADNNPNVPWKYQYRVMEDGSYVYYDLAKDTREGVVNTWNTNDYAAIAKTQGDLVTSTTNDVLNLSPWTDTHQAVLTFVAPYSGKVDISMTNGGVFAPHQGADGVSFWLLQNENEVISVSNLDTDYNAEGSRFFAGTKTLSVEEGDVIRFVVGRNSSLDGRTYFNPKIGYATIIKDSTIEGTESQTTYYISSSEGSDENDGMTPTTPWKSFSKVKDLELLEGVSVLLKAGDTWNEQLILNQVSGTQENPVRISSYGDGTKPVLNLQKEEDTSTASSELAVPVVLLNNAEGVEISNLSITGSGVGIDFHYQNSFSNEYVKVKNCTFTNLTGFHQKDGRTQSAADRYYMAGAITLTITNNCVGITDPAVIGFYIEQCTTNACGTLYTWGASPYYLNEGSSLTVRGFYITDCVMTNNTYYGTLIGGDGGYIDGCTITGCGTDPTFTPGTAGIMVCASDFDIINTEISEQQRGGQAFDGVAIDFEQSCDNVTVSNCYLHDNTGAGVLIYDSNKENNEGTNYNCKITNNIFENNLTKATGTTSPYNDPYCDVRILSSKGYALKDSAISGNQYLNSINGYEFCGDYQPWIYEISANNTIKDNTALTTTATYVKNVELSQSCKEKIYDTKGTTADYRAGRTGTIENTVVGTDVFTAASANPDTSNWIAKYYDIISTKTWKELAYNSETQQWTYGTAGSVGFTTGHIMPNTTGVIAIVFSAPKSGRICIEMEENIYLRQANPMYDGVYITVLNDNMELICDPIDLTSTNWSQTFPKVYVDVTEGENIYFCVSKKEGNAADSTAMKPIIQYVYTFDSVHVDDEEIDVTDIVRLKKYIADKATEVDAYNADFNGDGAYDDIDVTILRTYMVEGYVTQE